MSAKTFGKNQVVKFSSVIEKSRINFSDRDFYNAIEKNELTYHFQPIFCSRRQRFAGVEGLIRWNTDKSLLLPDRFYEAFSQFLTKTHQRSYQHNLFVTSLSECSIDDMQFVTYNISKADFLEVEFNHLLKELTPLLSKIDVVLELSENMIFEGANNAHYPQLIEDLKARGFKLALDDFGKDLSNLNRLIEIDVDLVKLDRSLIKNCSVDPKKLKILSSFSRLFSELNIKVIAEGMETLAEAQALSKIGIDLHQGYFFSRPVAASSVDQGYLLKIFEQNYEEQSSV
jgi:EAL domain-containing protein (putative c-di-GMP-specific phosphodiesterase class I)